MALLTGIRVLDLTAAAAGPFATQMLADLGAEVVKVEPLTGEHGRQWGDWHENDYSFMFLAGNRNKRSVAIDLKSEEGAKRIAKLAAESDIALVSLAPPRAKQFGVDYDSLSELNERLVYVAVTGYGLTGPRSGDNGMDTLLQADTGITSFTGEPGRPPVRIPVSALDMMTGSMAFAGVLAALRDRDQTGRGQLVEVSLFDTAMAMLLWAIPQVSLTGQEPKRVGSDFEALSPYSVWTTADGYAFIGAPTDAIWVELCKELGLSDLIVDLRFVTNGERVTHREELRTLLAQVFEQQPTARWLQRLRPRGVLISKIRSVAEAIDDEHTIARGTVQPLPGVPGVKVAATPLRMQRGFIPHSEWTRPPGIGEHTLDYFDPADEASAF